MSSLSWSLVASVAVFWFFAYYVSRQAGLQTAETSAKTVFSLLFGILGVASWIFGLGFLAWFGVTKSYVGAIVLLPIGFIATVPLIVVEVGLATRFSEKVPFLVAALGLPMLPLTGLAMILALG